MDTENQANEQSGDAKPVEASAPLVPQPIPAGPRVGSGLKLVEDWARAKGMFPEFVEKDFPPGFKARPKAKKPRVHNKNFRNFHAARAAEKWPPGKETTEAEFDAAIARNQGHIYR